MSTSFYSCTCILLLVLSTYAAIQCSSPPRVENAEILADSAEYFVGVTVRYRCNAQYQLDVAATVIAPQGVLTVVCNDRGEWHLIPTCIGE